jgi:hypothetical protein
MALAGPTEPWQSYAVRSWLSVLAAALLLSSMAACRSVPTASSSPRTTPISNASPARSASPEPTGSPTSPNEDLVKCEDLKDQRYTSTAYGFSVQCPSGFWWGTFRNAPPGWLSLYRTVDDRYVNGYPAGQIEIGVRNLDSDSLRHWVDQRVGPPYSSDGSHIWDSVTNVREISLAGSTGLAFDFVMAGSESPYNFHDVALVLQSKFVLVIDWWAYAASRYGPAIGKVADAFVASVTVS